MIVALSDIPISFVFPGPKVAIIGYLDLYFSFTGNTRSIWGYFSSGHGAGAGAGAGDGGVMGRAL